MQKTTLSFIPNGSILGLNYSGMHDSAIAIVGPDGAPVFAISLERLSRKKQDGRPPYALLEDMPWERIDSIAMSTEERLTAATEPAASRIHPIRFTQFRKSGEAHEKPFYDFLESLPRPKRFVCHHLSHASSAFWPSGHKSALCLTYDGGMSTAPGSAVCISRTKPMAYARWISFHWRITPEFLSFIRRSRRCWGIPPTSTKGKSLIWPPTVKPRRNAAMC